MYIIGLTNMTNIKTDGHAAATDITSVDLYVAFNTLRPKQNGRHFQIHFRKWKYFDFEDKLTEMFF